MFIGMPVCALILVNSPSHAEDFKLPPQLAGRWMATKSFSSVEYYDKFSNTHTPPSGWGGIYNIFADGRYTRTFIFRTSIYSCTETITIHHEGIATVKGNEITFNDKKITRTEKPCSGPEVKEALPSESSAERWWLQAKSDNLSKTCLFLTKNDICYERSGDPGR